MAKKAVDDEAIERTGGYSPDVERLIAKGKEPKVALVACMRKLIVILNVMLARRQKWDPSLHRLS